MISILFLLESLYVVNDKKYVIVAFVLFYILPIMGTFAGINRNMRGTLFVFVVSALLTCALFSAGVSIPNYCIISFLLIITFAEQVIEELYDNVKMKRYILSITCILGIFYIVSNNFQSILFLNPNDSYHEVLSLQKVEYKDEPFNYSSETDAELAKLNALKANHIHYNILPSRADETMAKTSMAMSFLPEGYENIK